ncbi:uncharacterized protein GIQ15_06185 [Arthroderma uncinatum]|uniref:uncharacterized protein n=1 Tax=Arthroderma uncinatum TaxID=74035 RepID=UPI00144A65FC|nr:uncharacterized protein GIQ15_06185 [Arthroderma uncinatum]KAF3480838.1 hypothetical protein GIQ15_06185 [Arthroderma uncinatum]
MDKDQPKPPGKPKSREEASTSTSMAGRIQSSAAGLLRTTISPSSPSPSNSYAFANGISSSLASVSSSEKAAPASGSSSASHGPGVESGFHHGLPSESGFRSQQPQAQIHSHSEQEFHQGGGLPLDDVGVYDLSDSKGKGKGKGKGKVEEERFDSAWMAATTASNTRPSISRSEQEQRDGEAVSALLSSSSFDPLSLPEDELDIEPEPDMDFLIPGSDQTQRPLQPSISSTSLIPDIDFVLTSLRNAPAQSQTEHLRDLPGVAEWLDLDAEYQDVVWGYLKPRVEEARQEVQERSERGEQGVGDGPAVMRLRMVLAHLKEGKGMI